MAYDQLFNEKPVSVYNPAFLKRVREKRRIAAAEQEKLARQAAISDRQSRIDMLAAEARAARIEILAKKAARETAAFDQMLAKAAVERREDRDRFERIVKLVCKVTAISPAVIFSPVRTERIMLARQTIYYWASRRTNLSIARIGTLMGRDHTSVLSGNKAYVRKRAAQGRKLRVAR